MTRPHAWGEPLQNKNALLMRGVLLAGGGRYFLGNIFEIKKHAVKAIGRDRHTRPEPITASFANVAAATITNKAASCFVMFTFSFWLAGLRRGHTRIIRLAEFQSIDKGH